MTPTATTYKLTQEMTGYPGSSQTISPSKLNLWVVTKVNKDGTFEMASYYVSNDVNFYGSSGYYAYLDTLDTVAEQYMNSNYLISTRYYDGRAEKAYTIGTNTATEYFYPNQSKGADSSGYTRYRLQTISAYGEFSPYGGEIVFQSTPAPVSNPTSSATVTAGLRIIATVKAGLNWTGAGTKSNPYVLN